MKKTLIRNVLIMLVVCAAVGIATKLYLNSSSSVAVSAAALNDGTYTCAAQGLLSEVSVTLTVSGGAVTDVQIDAAGETPELGGKAAETLSAAILSSGSADVDAVAGATVTSNAVQAAAADCLAQAQG